MSVTIKLRRGTTAQWSSANPTLAIGEVGIDTDLKQLKVGDGATAWSSLAFTTAPINSPAFTGTVVLPSATSIGDVSNTEISYLDGVTSSIQTQLNAKANTTISTNLQTASYTLVAGDAGKLVEMNVGSANNLTVPLNSSVPFPVGTKIDILQVGAGQTTVVATGGVTINANPGIKLSGQWAAASLVKRATDNWVLIGNITA
jgi:hypothetical protein